MHNWLAICKSRHDNTPYLLTIDSSLIGDLKNYSHSEQYCAFLKWIRKLVALTCKDQKRMELTVCVRFMTDGSLFDQPDQIIVWKKFLR